LRAAGLLGDNRRRPAPWLAELRDADGRGLPRYVDRELAEYL